MVGREPQFFEIVSHFLTGYGEFGLDLINVTLDSGYIDLGFRFKGVHVARDIDAILVCPFVAKNYEFDLCVPCALCG
jgi:hypothetical protein